MADDIRNYTTPTITLTVSKIDLTGNQVFVTFKSGDTILTFTNDDFNIEYDAPDTTIEIEFSQEQSALFTGEALCQINWLTAGGERNATCIRSVNFSPNLLDEVI